MKARVIVCLVVFASALLVAIASVAHTSSMIFFTTDFAVSLSVARLALEGELPLLGPTSHIGGRHFGPWYYYALVGAMKLAGGGVEGTVLWLSIFNLVGFVFVVATVYLLVPFRDRSVAALGTLLCGAGTHYVFVLRMPWHAHFYFIPIAALYFTVLLALRRHPLGVPLFALVASLAIQTHYMCLPLVAIFSVVLWAERGIFSRYHCPGVHERRGIAAFSWVIWAFAALSWVPLVVYEIKYGGALVGFLKAAGGAHGPRAGMMEALEAFSHYWKIFTLPLGPVHRFISNALVEDAVLWLFTLGLIALAAKAFLVLDHAARLFTIACVAGGLVYVPLIARVAAPIPDYFLHSLLPLPAILIGALFAISFSPFGGYFNPFRLLGLILGALWILGANANQEKYSGRPYARWHTAQHSIEMARLIDRDREEQGTLDDPVIILAKGETRLSLAGYYYMLSGRHYSQLPEARRYLELPSMDITPIREAIRAHPTSYLTVCPRPPPHHRQAMWQKVKARWKLETELSTTGYGALRNCKVYRLHRRAEKKDGSPPRSAQNG